MQPQLIQIHTCRDGARPSREGGLKKIITKILSFFNQNTNLLVRFLLRFIIYLIILCCLFDIIIKVSNYL